MKNNLRLQIMLRILRQKSFKGKLCLMKEVGDVTYSFDRYLKQYHQNMVLTSFLPICFYI